MFQLWPSKRNAWAPMLQTMFSRLIDNGKKLSELRLAKMGMH